MTDTKIQSKFLGNAAPTEKGQQVMDNFAAIFVRKPRNEPQNSLTLKTSGNR